MKKTKFIAIRITSQQQQALRIAAAFKNISISDYVIGALYDKIAADRATGALEIPKFVR